MYKYKIVDEESLPIYGYKIHISATLDNYKDIYNLLSPLLDDRKISYKYIYIGKKMWLIISLLENLLLIQGNTLRFILKITMLFVAY